MDNSFIQNLLINKTHLTIHRNGELTYENHVLS
jgi:hypothetical protein